MQFFSRKLLATAVLIGSVALLTGCEEKLEAPSLAVLQASIQKVSKDMDPVEKVKFQQAFESATTYAYAKNHDGRTPEMNVGALFSQVLRGMQGQKVDTAADDATERDILKMFDGKTASDVIDKKEDWDKEIVGLKAQWQKAQEALALKRQQEIQENSRLQKLEYARQRKTQLTQNIAQLEQNIPKLEAQINEAEALKKPYVDAVADYSKVEIKNVTLKVEGKRNRYVEFDVVNGSQVQFNEVRFRLVVNAGSTNVANANGRDSVPGDGVAPGATYHISQDISSSGAFRYAPDDLTVDLKLVTATDNGRKVSVAENLDDAGWKHWTESNLVNAKNQLEQTNKRIADFKKQLTDMDQPDASA